LVESVCFNLEALGSKLASTEFRNILFISIYCLCFKWNCCLKITSEYERTHPTFITFIYPSRVTFVSVFLKVEKPQLLDNTCSLFIVVVCSLWMYWSYDRLFFFVSIANKLVQWAVMYRFFWLVVPLSPSQFPCLHYGCSNDTYFRLSNVILYML